MQLAFKPGDHGRPSLGGESSPEPTEPSFWKALSLFFLVGTSPIRNIVPHKTVFVEVGRCVVLPC